MASELKNPVFLICSERSGSNLIREMMGAHSQLFAPMPMHLLDKIGSYRYKYGDLHRNRNWKLLVRHVTQLIENQIGELGYPITETELLNNARERSFKALFDYIYLKGINMNQKSRLFLKENHNYTNIGFITENYPNAKFIVQVRDPRDMVLSMKKSPINDPDFFRAIHIWEKDQRATLKLMYHIDSRKTHIHRYEDLLSHPQKVLTSICDFLELPFDDALLEFHKTESAKKSSKASAAWQNLDKGLLNNNQKKYRKELTHEEIRIIEYNLHELMEHFNYEADFSRFTKRTRVLNKLGDTFLRTFINQLLSNSKKIGIGKDEREKRKNYRRLLRRMNRELQDLEVNNLSV